MLFCHHSAAVYAKHLALGPHRDIRGSSGGSPGVLRDYLGIGLRFLLSIDSIRVGYLIRY